MFKTDNIQTPVAEPIRRQNDLPPFALFASKTFNARASVPNEIAQDWDDVQLRYEVLYNGVRNASLSPEQQKELQIRPMTAIPIP